MTMVVIKLKVNHMLPNAMRASESTYTDWKFTCHAQAGKCQCPALLVFN